MRKNNFLYIKQTVKMKKEEIEEIQKSFKEIEQSEETGEKKVKKNKDGKFSHTDFARKFSPSELTESKIKDLVNEQFPLYKKDEDGVDEKMRKERSHLRSKLKTALKERSAEASMPKEPVVEIKEEVPDEERSQLMAAIEDIHAKFPSNDDLPEEILKEMPIEDLRKYLGEIGNRAIEIVNSGSAEFMFTLLLLGSQTVESLAPVYGYSMTGLYQKHKEQKENLCGILGEVLEENPEVARFFSPKNRLFLTVAGLYGTTAFENNFRKQ